MTAHLRLAPTLAQHEVTAGHLTREHHGRTAAVRFHRAVLVGQLHTVTESVMTGEPAIILDLGGRLVRFTLPHNHPVTVAPAGARLSVTLGVQQ